MAFFLVPAVEAVITTIAEKVIKSKEKNEIIKIAFSDGSVGNAEKIKFSKKLGWLNKLLWGGSALLAFEHIWHGEIIPSLPILTAVQNGETSAMLSEMTTTGSLMALIVTAVWCGMLAVSSVIEKKAVKEAESLKEGN